MRPAHERERAIGIAHYVADTGGIGGQLRRTPEAFRVREIEGVTPEPLDAPADRYPHLLVRVTLRDWDTNAFAGALSDRLGISRERIAWAGTKDKRAVTTQLVSITGVEPDALPAMDDAELEPVGRFGRALRFGDLAGNAFEVTVADPEHPDRADAITDDLATFAGGTPGVPNFFGHQRFGSVRPITHEVGLAVLRGDWKGAVMAYVADPDPAEPEDTRTAREYVAGTEDWRGGLERMPRRLTHERAMLHRLVEADADADPEGAYRAALRAVPENLQRLFVHAAQSYVFNRVLSARLEAGLPFHRAVAGDVVCFADEVGGLVVPDPDRSQAVTDRRLGTVNRHCERGRAFVTAPLVGTDTDFGDGEPGEIERGTLADLGLERSDFDRPAPFGSTGTRRAVLVRADPDVTPVADGLCFEFSLPRGAYATTLLREYLQTPPRGLT